MCWDRTFGFESEADEEELGVIVLGFKEQGVELAKVGRRLDGFEFGDTCRALSGVEVGIEIGRVGFAGS